MKVAGVLGVFLSVTFLTSCDGGKEDTNTSEQSKPTSPGVLAAEIEVDIDRTALASHGLTPTDVHDALDAFISSRKVFSVDDIKDISIILRHDRGSSVKLGTVASARVNLSASRDNLREGSAR